LQKAEFADSQSALAASSPPVSRMPQYPANQVLMEQWNTLPACRLEVGRQRFWIL